MRFNPIYLVAIIAVVALWQLSDSLQSDSLIFYGFAENKETEINLEYPVEVKRIYVTNGQRVAAGTILADTEQADLPKQQTDALLRIEEIRADNARRSLSLQNQIGELEAQMAQRSAEIDAKIGRVRQRAERNRQLLQEIEVPASGDRRLQESIDALRDEEQRLLQPLTIELAGLRRELAGIQQNQRARIQRLENEADFFENKTRKFSLTAPTDGLIGNVHIKEAEFVSSFNTLITFYEENPTLVNGFVQENMSVHVHPGDSVTVVSTVRPDSQCRGVVTGLGSRYIEIPPRLRKMPELKTYGREILIAIPARNDFLQKEKVVIRLEETPATAAQSFSGQ